MPHPSYELRNLSGNLARQRKRLEQLRRPPVDRIITARYAGECASCGAELERGQAIRYSKSAGARCVDCGGGEAV